MVQMDILIENFPFHTKPQFSHAQNARRGASEAQRVMLALVILVHASLEPGLLSHSDCLGSARNTSTESDRKRVPPRPVVNRARRVDENNDLFISLNKFHSVSAATKAAAGA
jgi:hypothetical protein